MRSLFTYLVAVGVAVTVLTTACTREGGGSSASAGQASPSASTTASSAPAGPISEAVRKAICSAAPCGSEHSFIYVYRDAQGTVKKLYRQYGGCSHSPGIYFDPDGTQTEVIAERPIAPGSDDERAFRAKHDAQIGQLKRTDTISCRDRAPGSP